MTLALMFVFSGAIGFMLVFFVALVRDTSVSRSELHVSRVENIERSEPEREKRNACAA